MALGNPTVQMLTPQVQALLNARMQQNGGVTPTQGSQPILSPPMSGGTIANQATQILANQPPSVTTNGIMPPGGINSLNTPINPMASGRIFNPTFQPNIPTNQPTVQPSPSINFGQLNSGGAVATAPTQATQPLNAMTPPAQPLQRNMINTLSPYGQGRINSFISRTN